MVYFYKVQKLHCSGCAARIEEALLRMEGVEGVSIDMETRKMRVESIVQPSLQAMNVVVDDVEKGTYVEELEEVKKIVAQLQKEKVYFYHVQKLHCSGCAARIEEALLRMDGVVGASIDMERRKLRLESAVQPSLQAMNVMVDDIEKGTYLESIEEAPAEVTSTQKADTHEHEDEMHGPTVKTMIICAVLMVVGLLAEAFVPAVESNATLGRIITLFCFAIPYVLCGHSVLMSGWESFQKKDFFNEFTLMGGATIAAIIIGHLEEAVGVMLFYCIGEYVQERAAGNSRRSIRALLAAKPSIAHVCDAKGHNVQDMEPENVALDSYVLVRPGEKIPLDGVVVDGISEVDTAPLTGESMPVMAEEGKHVFAGCINKDSALVIQVTEVFQNTSVARILEMVESANARKAPTERFITRFARYYTPGVVATATLVALLPPLLGGGDFSEWVYKALVLLVVSCPCALIISIPLGYFGGIGAASRRGILVKGGYVLDALQHVKVAAFDKTGTLTHGTFSITQKHTAAGVSEEELTSWAGLAESRSNHPLAKAIVKDCLLKQGKMREVGQLHVHEHAGKGVVAEADADVIVVGTREFLQSMPEITGIPEASVLDSLAKEGGSLALVAKNTVYLGCLVGADTLRPEAAQALNDLRSEGITTLAMLTGDHELGAQTMAKKLPLDVVKSRLLPDQKAHTLESLAPTKETLFMGDGINDAPVLATAGIGIAMGGLGSEAAIETADVVVLDDSPARVPELLRIATKTRQIVWQNIVMALSIKGLFVCLGIVGVSGLWEAVFADVGVALLAVLNASRAMKI